MKAALWITTALFASFHAAQAATPLECQDSNGGPDSGYTVNFLSHDSRVVVSEQSIAGPRVVANLVCSRTGQARGFADEMIPLITCIEPNLRDAGYVLEVKTGGFAGITTASLKEISLAGTRQVTTFLCR